MKIWARVGMAFEVDEVIYKADPKLAMLTALHEGKVKLDGETYIPANVEFTSGREEAFDFFDVPIKTY